MLVNVYCLVHEHKLSLALYIYTLLQFLPAGDWHCPYCICKFCGNGSDIAQEDDITDCALITCSLCEKKCSYTLVFGVLNSLKFEVAAVVSSP